MPMGVPWAQYTILKMRKDEAEMINVMTSAFFVQLSKLSGALKYFLIAKIMPYSMVAKMILTQFVSLQGILKALL